METMPAITQSFKINYEYKLLFTQNLFAPSNPLFKNVLAQYKSEERIKVLFVIDSGVNAAHPALVQDIKSYCDANKEGIQYTNHIVITGGEACKNDSENVTQILEAINANAICRHSFVIAIGGGAVVDMVGYAATIAHRGVQLIRIPTTVLAQNDAAVGVKNSVNSFGKKNFLGTFSTPFAIINDSNFLNTLEQRDWISGIAEAIKVALIKDADFFSYIDENALNLKERDPKAMQHVIYKCAEMHMQHIANGGDPFESGSSRPLDFGHWAAHKLEHMTQYSLRHGEAVAIGIALDVAYAYLIGLIPQESLHTIINVFKNIGFEVKVPLDTDQDIEELLKGVEEFREHLGGELTITLLSKIGTKKDVHTIDYIKMKQAIKLLNNLDL